MTNTWEGTMRATLHKASLILLALGLGNAAAAAQPGDGCIDFKWDVGKERALFRGNPARLSAGADTKSAPTVEPNRLYSLRLTAQENVTFAVPPARKSGGAPAYAGLANLKITAPGSYRIAVDLPFWIDVASNGTLLAAEDFQGQHECSAPHKIVVFALTGAQPFILQLSGAASESVLLTVTPAPARKL
jgi:hypothetical protein